MLEQVDDGASRTEHVPARAEPSRSESGSVKSADRTLAILELLTAHERGLSFAALATRLDLPRSSLHGLLRTLIGRGWIHADPASRRYTMGIRAWEAGRAYERAFDLAERANPHMHRVRDALDETVQLALLDDRFALYVAKLESGQHLTLQTAIGRRNPAHAVAIGKTLLADLQPAELAPRLKGVKLERFTAKTITDTAVLETELARVRKRGFALDEEEFTTGVRCIAFPVRDASGRAIAAMSVSAPTIRFGRAARSGALAILAAEVEALSRALGYAAEA